MASGSEPRNVLVVSCHPLAESLCSDLCDHVLALLDRQPADVTHLDLYAAGFDPVLSAGERRSYRSGRYDGTMISEEADALVRADMLILIFPVWWFGFPAMLTGWFDRVWAPGVAYDHSENAGPIKPRLERLRQCIAVTTMGSPWWVDRFVLNRPVRRVLARALIGACAPHCRLRMLTLYSADAATSKTVDRFRRRIDGVIPSLFP